MSVVISGTLIALFCFVRESKTPFKVTLGRDNDVFDFKNKPNNSAKIDIDNIKLWKPVSGENIEELQNIIPHFKITRIAR
ncbi:hypothetical protein C2G38_2233038 [Gigaspora rosea]|uniref:Uncharacterized protein n=1 Tax=Gigaspora rosea TaxID=44941 RepID=A0A397U123_9GLOM|nr:hypothetical protein C2G38_2233038 [Gigaspora rosea]